MTAWGFKELEILKREYEMGDLKELSQKLNRSKDSIRARAYKLGLSRRKNKTINVSDDVFLKKELLENLLKKYPDDSFYMKKLEEINELLGGK